MSRPRLIVLILLEMLITVTAGIFIFGRIGNVFIVLALFAVLSVSSALIASANNRYLSDKATRPGLVLAVIIEFWIIVFYPLVFLFFKPMCDIEHYPEFSKHYENDTKYVVIKKNLNYRNYHNNTTNKDSDGTIFRVPKGSRLEVGIVDMKGYPDMKPQITTCFYDCESGCYTLWGGIDLDWIENPEDITRDLDAVRAEEARNNRIARIKTYSGLAASVLGSAAVVLVIWLLLRKHKEYHIVMVAVMVTANILISYFTPGLKSTVGLIVGDALLFLFI